MYEAVGIAVTAGGREILDGVDLVLQPGSVTVLIGPNGAGKTTLLKIIAGERKPGAGRTTLHGADIARMPVRELARWRAVLPQSVHLAFPFTVEEVVRFGQPASAKRAGNVAERALAAVGLGGEGKRVCLSLSGGEQQRVHLARALAQLWAEPDDGRARYLLLDEPTASLDLAHQLLVLRLAREHAASGGGVLAILHDLNLAAIVADRIVALRSGRVVAAGPPAAVITDELLSDTYRLALAVNAVQGAPFVLPRL